MTAPDLVRFAGLLADSTRATFCVSLLDGRAWTAGELARSAGVAPSTATEHINQLISGGVLVERRQGRHRYVQLANARTAELIETIAAHAPRGSSQPSSLRSATIASALTNGRTCYDHLAGRLGVQITQAMLSRKLLSTDHGLTVTAPGQTWLTDLGIDLPALRRSRRPFIRECLDWTERQSHLAGSIGAALCQRFFDTGWITRTGSSRAVRLTKEGTAALHEHLGLPTDPLPHNNIPNAPQHDPVTADLRSAPRARPIAG